MDFGPALFAFGQNLSLGMSFKRCMHESAVKTYERMKAKWTPVYPEGGRL